MSRNVIRAATLVAAGILAALTLPVSVLAAEPTTTELAEPSGTIGWFEPIHLIAIVRPTPEESGLVTLTRDGTQVATDMTNPNGVASFSLGGLPPGTYTFVAEFAGTDDSLPSSSTPLQLVTVDDRTPVTITVGSAQNPSLRKDKVPFTVTVDPVPDTGQVSVFHNSSSTSEPIDPSGHNTIEHGFQDAGTFTVNACFGGSTVYKDTCTTLGVDQVVVAYDTTTTFSIEPSSLYVDEGLVIHVSVDPAPDVPASVIVRRMWDPALWTIPLDPVTGEGQLDVPGGEVSSRLEWGENELIAQFGGTDHMNASNSDPLIVFGKSNATRIELDVEPTVVAPGGSVVATAKVVPAPPEGSLIEFFFRGPNGTYTYGSGMTDATGSASGTIASISNWPLGDYAALEARYGGDLRFGASLASVPIVIGFDSDLPSATAPRLAILPNSTMIAGRVMTRVVWSGNDDTSGVARYQLQQRIDGGAWVTVRATLTRATLDLSLATQHGYAFRVRAVDNAGFVGPWATGPSVSLARYSETNPAIRYSGTWHKTSASVFSGGGAKWSKATGASATFTFTGRSVAFVSRLGPTKGKARIYLDGKHAATVDLHASTYKGQRVVWARTLATAGRHSVTVVVVGTRTRPRIDIDAFIRGG